MRVTVNVLPHPCDTASEYVTVVPGQLSLAVAMPVLETLVSPGQSKVTSAGQFMLGEIVSNTVTVAVQVLVAPPPSVTVRVTEFGPRSVQLNEVGLAAIVPSQSSLPLSISASTMETLPPPSR